MPPIVIVVCFPFKPREILARASRLSERPATRLAGDSFCDRQGVPECLYSATVPVDRSAREGDLARRPASFRSGDARAASDV